MAEPGDRIKIVYFETRRVGNEIEKYERIIKGALIAEDDESITIEREHNIVRIFKKVIARIEKLKTESSVQFDGEGYK